MPLRSRGSFTLAPVGAWPSSPGRLTPSLDDDNTSVDDDDFDTPLLQRDNPLTYFLTPSTPKDEDDIEFDFDFDAGIEDANSPRAIVRSVSPSTLDGLRKFKPKNKSPKPAHDIDSTTASASAHRGHDSDDDDEDYIRFRPNEPLPFGFENFFDRPSQAARVAADSADALLSPANFHVGSPNSKPSKRRFAPPRRALRGRSLQLQRRHSWREPSPDVWCIDEEPEKETMSEMGVSTEDLASSHKTMPIYIPSTKPIKKVRFVLPIEE